MSHTLHGHAIPRLGDHGLAVKLALVAMLLAAAIVAIVLITDDSTPGTPTPSVSASMIAHPEEGGAAIAVPAVRPEEGSAAIADGGRARTASRIAFQSRHP